MRVRVIALACALIALCACAVGPPMPADLVLYNGRVYTVDGDPLWVQGVAVRAGRIVRLGDDAAVLELLGPSTRSVDLDGRLVMPGLIDGHVHPVTGTGRRLFECAFPFTATPADIADTLSTCIARQPEAGWIVGGQWTSDFFLEHDLGSPRRWLDAVSRQHAIVLGDDSGHNSWANTRALELAGVGADTPDPVDGAIGREADGRTPNGLLLEGASARIAAAVPERSAADYRRAVETAVREANGFGITGFKDAHPSEAQIAAYAELGRAGITAHVAVCLPTPYGEHDQALDIEPLIRMRERYTASNVDPRFVKLFLDGVPTAARTAAMLEPYSGTGTYGTVHIPQTLLVDHLVRLDRAGFTVKIHAAGDRSVRLALDALAATRRINRNSTLRHEVAHAGYVHPDDVPRFGQLNVVADLSPYLWYPSPIVSSVVAAVGSPRGERYFPVKSLLAADAPMLAGSDWPAAVASMNPWVGLEALVTRSDPSGATPGTLWPEQAITLSQAVQIYTLDGARALRLEADTGSLSVGKWADMIVLEHNIFDIDISRVHATRVDMTFFQGALVHER